jgi:hypothetical protein
MAMLFASCSMARGVALSIAVRGQGKGAPRPNPLPEGEGIFEVQAKFTPSVLLVAN